MLTEWCRMRVSKTTVIILISMILMSVFFANVVNLLSIDEAALIQTKTKDDRGRITDNYESLMWFLQITDIHISIFQDPFRITEFKEFCQYTVETINPSVVLASGDLTDAKTSDSIGSQQFQREWQYYRNILNECHIREKTLWLDIRGNHDNFNVASQDSRHNYFSNFSIQGKKHPRSYMYQINKGGDLYSFIAVDACLEPGPRRPFNFIGMIDQYEVDEINKLIDKARGSNYTIWFGHFPTSCILSTGYEHIRDLIGKDQSGLVYVCGHLHKLGGLVPKMYTLQKAGFLELELGDWKDNRMYRLMVVDHGMFSFLDIQHRDWPIAIITNPKHALYLNPSKENVNKLKTSTHIRVIAFSMAEILYVAVRVDNGLWQDCYHVEGPLYATKWNPQKYLKGIHEIRVHIKDSEGREKVFSQPFTLDDQRLSFDILPRLVLMTDASTIFRTMFGFMLMISILPLAILRLVHKMVKDERLPKPRTIRNSCLKLWLRKFWVLSTVDRIFWPTILYPIYLTFGPWSIGYLVEDHLGVIFAWGIFVNGHFLPGSFTYAYGFIQLVTFQVPLTIILAHGVDHHFQRKVLQPDKKKSFCSHVAVHLPFFFVFGIQVTMAYLFWLAYGTLAFILGPLRTWSLVLAAVLWYQAIYLPEKCTRRAAEIWHRKSDDFPGRNDVIKQ